MTGKQLDRVRDTIEVLRSDDFRRQLAQALPPTVTVQRFVQVAATAIQANPDVVAGNRATLYRAVVRCAQDGLLPDGREAALVVYRDGVQYMPMVGGLRKIAFKQGLSLTAYVVYAADTFDYELGAHPRVVHKPAPLDKDRGLPIGAYAVAIDSRDRAYIEVMTTAEIEKVRAVSRARNGPWKDWWEEMARKTVARRLFKQLPIGDLAEADSRVLAADEMAFTDSGAMDEEDTKIAVRIGPAFTPDDTPDFPIPEAAQQELIEQGDT